MKNLTKIALAALFTGAVGTANAQLPIGEDCGCPAFGDRTTVLISTISDANGNLSASTTLTCDNIYELDQTLYVGDGQVLSVQAGTIIRGQQGAGLNAKSVVVSRGGKIIANGTATCPIHFTSTLDNFDGTKSLRDNAEWGGLIMLGKATNNLLLADGGLAVADGVGSIEGFDNSDSRTYYGDPGTGFEDNDDSGVLRYVSIRHGGSVVGDPSLGNDINGLTLGSIGNGTTIEHVEVVANFDDGMEWFGGTVDGRYLSVIFAGDDQFDYDQGYIGEQQFLFGLEYREGAVDIGDEGFEYDGDDEDSDNTPSTFATIYNATVVGNGSDRGMLMKERPEGLVANSIFANFDVGLDLADESDRSVDAIDNFITNETLSFSNNCFVDVNSLITVGGAAASATVENTFTGAGNVIVADLINTTTFDIDTVSGTAVEVALNFVPAAGTASVAADAPVDGFFTSAQYCGAFAPGTSASWLSDFSTVDALDLDNSLVSCPADINGDGDINTGDLVQFLGEFGNSCAIE